MKDLSPFPFLHAPNNEITKEILRLSLVSRDRLRGETKREDYADDKSGQPRARWVCVCLYVVAAALQGTKRPSPTQLPSWATATNRVFGQQAAGPPDTDGWMVRTSYEYAAEPIDSLRPDYAQPAAIARRAPHPESTFVVRLDYSLRPQAGSRSAPGQQGRSGVDDCSEAAPLGDLEPADNPVPLREGENSELRSIAGYAVQYPLEHTAATAPSVEPQNRNRQRGVVPCPEVDPIALPRRWTMRGIDTSHSRTQTHHAPDATGQNIHEDRPGPRTLGGVAGTAGVSSDWLPIRAPRGSRSSCRPCLLVPQQPWAAGSCQDRVRVEARQRDLVAAATTPHRQLAEAGKAGSWLDGAGSGRSASAGRDPLNPGTRACLASDSGAASRAVVVAKWLSAVGSAVACSETPNCERGRGLAQCGVGQYGGVRMGHDTMLPYEPRMVEHGSVRQSFFMSGTKVPLSNNRRSLSVFSEQILDTAEQSP
ncbi:hypothetical protein Purlil1_4684 [Purpureocillium lilacinum]|uniref:Uncharacterized protein n=1 Tax=Purpureocillium lilacinum TaxID=33203 RepID=A0ABR0C4N1_PURLI|nr:hypothetical protein Purlil1_4684 [Purpureocillium lilacinum]